MKRCTTKHTDTVAAWLETYYAERIRVLLLTHNKEIAAKLLRDELHEVGITYACGVYLSRAQIRQALTRFERPHIDERRAYAALLSQDVT